MSIFKILDIKDNYRTSIKLNDRIVHMVDDKTIQVEKWFRQKYTDNNLSILYQKSPKLVEYKEGAPLDINQEVDLPPQLLDLLLLAISKNAHSIGQQTIDPRTGTPYLLNPYIERFELAMKNAVDNAKIQPLGTDFRCVHTKGFI